MSVMVKREGKHMVSKQDCERVLSVISMCTVSINSLGGKIQEGRKDRRDTEWLKIVEPVLI